MAQCLRPIQRQRTIQNRSHGRDFNPDLCLICMHTHVGQFSCIDSKAVVYLCLFARLHSHIMKELIATERIYVDELLSVLLVRMFCSP